MRKTSIDTRAVHAGEPRPRIEGAVTLPIFQTSTYASAGESGYHDIRYLRLSNSPNHLALHAKLAALEGSESALVTASGMAAISTALLCVLKSGDHLLAQRGLYGGSHTFMTHELPALGIGVDFVDGADLAQWARKCKPATRAFYVESMTNPLLEVGDLPAAAAFARDNGLVSLIDNTLATPVNFRPIEIGFDIVLHSATKYLNGHSDIVAGVIAGNAERVGAAKQKLDHLGASLDPHSCFLLSRGIKTLPLRVRRQNQNAQALAEFLQAHPAAAAVHYAGLPGHPSAARARALFGEAGFGGVLSFEHRDGRAGARRMMQRLELAVNAVSLGGTETLVTLPAETSHAGLRADEREAAGIK
ncbi:MAG: PLP-dependent aspartate aminotransferase family protein, partial [Gammaproteobacteria bacterium]